MYSLSCQRGNVLFLILIAVVLFAALSYAITKSSRGGGNDITEEKAQLIASEITQYGTTIETAIQRLRFSQGCKETDISFETDLTSYDYTHTPAAPAKCRVFASDAGGVIFREPKNWFDASLYAPIYATFISGDYSIHDVGTDAPELALFLIWIDPKVCHAINKRLGIAYAGTTPPGDAASAGGVEFRGSYTQLPDQLGDDAGSVYAGKMSGCVYDTPSGYYSYFHVLIPR